MSTGERMLLSYVIVSYNRRAALLRTLSILHAATPLPADAWETWVVDNGSTDGTVDAVARQFPQVQLLVRPENEGVWARSHAFSRARGRYLVLLDDDSYPLDDAVPRSIGYLESQPQVAGVVGRCMLPDGNEEGCAMPGVMLSGAVCLRRSVLETVGGFRREFFRKAGEYDLSFRIWAAGYRIERFQNIVYQHDKVTTGRSSELAAFMDLRNNLILVDRFLPPDARRAYRQDYLRRYVLLARQQGVGHILHKAIAEARQYAQRERLAGRPEVLDAATFERLFEWRQQEQQIARWATGIGARRVALQSFSKNLYATCRAARQAGLQIIAIADDHAAFRGATYRGVPVRPLREAVREVDGVVVSNINPAQVERCVESVQRVYSGPVLRLWSPQEMPPTAATPPRCREAG